MLRLNVVWQTAVTGQGLRDVIHTVHLQAGLIFKNTCRHPDRKRRVKEDIFKVTLYVGAVPNVKVWSGAMKLAVKRCHL